MFEHVERGKPRCKYGKNPAQIRGKPRCAPDNGKAYLQNKNIKF
jgi:hypothetical protein